MSIKKLFEKNRQTTVVSKYLKNTNISEVGSGLESAGHLSESLKKRDTFIPPLDYTNPGNFAKFGSAEKYYKDIFEYVVDYYPYDGSAFEKLKFENDLNLFEKYIFNEEYPKSTGHASFGLGYTGATSKASNYYSSSIGEYIRVKGGPHKTNLYNEEKNRTSNLEFGGPSGSTLEFFFKKGTGMPASGQSKNQVIFDLHNGIVSGSNDYGRLRVEIRSGSEDRFYVTMQSGGQVPSGFCRVPIPTTGNLDLTNGDWHQYAFAFETSLSQPKLTLYRDGKCVETISSTGSIGLVTGSLIGRIGALEISPSGTSLTLAQNAQAGFGRLSASLDEFRFWKKRRTSQEIGRYWFTNVDGGTNKYDANISLGVYYKFNEGIAPKTTIDRVVSDYSGRMSNGIWYGYDADYSRNLKSAINEMSMSNIHERGDVVVRPLNTRYTTVKDSLELAGKNYDYGNAAGLMNSIPTWIREQDENSEKELIDLVQILSNHFDVLHAQIGALSSIKNNDYVSGSMSGSLHEFPYNDRLLDNLGLETPELFKNIDTLQQFMKRDEQINFKQDLSAIKNTIYKNIHNNLISIYKSKGTEKSIRNFIRCLGVGENIIALNTYANNVDYKLLNNYRDDISTKKYVDFSGLSNDSSQQATVFQYYDAANANSVGLISGSTSGSHTLAEFAFTAEADIYFPDRSNVDKLSYASATTLTSSLFGYHTPSNNGPTSTNITWASDTKDWGLNVVAIKSPATYSHRAAPAHLVPDAYFAVRNREGNILLTSSVFRNIYDNERWNLALSVRPEKYPFVSGVLGAGLAKDTNFTLNFCGYNYNTGQLRNSFSKNMRLDYNSGSGYINSSKRLYMGALRTNHTGTLLLRSDIRASSLRYWTDFLPTGTINLHAREADSFGREHSYRNAYSFQGSTPGVFIPEIETLALNWDFAAVTSSNAAGRFKILDFSSGSNGTRYDEKYQGDVLTNINLRSHTGRGDLFEAFDKPVQKQYIFTQKLQLPEYAASGDMINILDADVETFTRDSRPVNYYFAVEKSLYRSISDRMLNLFASMAEYNDLVGEPVNKYRGRYKSLEKMREVFFRSNQATFIDFDKYVRFYKWLDSSMNEMIEQLFPASARFSENVRTVVESHVLERPKIKYGYTGNIKDMQVSPSGSIPGTICRDIPGWKFNHAPLNGNQNTNCAWWQNRALRTDPSLTSGDSGVDADRQKILRTRQTLLFSGGLVCISADLESTKFGGINQYPNKVRNARDFIFYSSSLRENTCADNLIPAVLQKSLVAYTAVKDGTNYEGKMLLPFTAISASTDGDVRDYKGLLKRKGLGYVDFANLHEDSTHPYQYSVPMQGPFTKDHVGGFASRHVRPLALKAKNTRAESWEMTFPSSGTGSIQTLITGSTPKGHHLRGLGSKSPVNIANIRTSTGSIQTYEGVARIGNFSENYEVVQTNDRSQMNVDLASNPSNYYVKELSGTMASAFITPPSRRAAGLQGLTGSLGYASPRQQSNTKKTKSVFVQRFAAPGSVYDSNQLFRDLASDQLSPNNALPFRNIKNRQTFYTNLKFYSGWGGFVTGSGIYQLNKYGGDELDNLNLGQPYIPSGLSSPIAPPPVSIHKVQRNTRERLEITSNTTRPTVKTGSLRDNGFVTRPIPDADRPAWFTDISGSDQSGITLRTAYIQSGSRFPSDISIPSKSFAIDAGNKAAGSITVNSYNAAQLNNVIIGITGSAMTDAGVPKHVRFQAVSALPVGSSSRVSPTHTYWGVNGGTGISDIVNSLFAAINYANATYDDIDVIATAASPKVQLAQVSPGDAGNTTLTKAADAASTIAFSQFAGGTESTTPDWGPGDFLGNDGKNEFLWEKNRGFATWNQLRRGDTNLGSYARRNNIYESELDPGNLNEINRGPLLPQIKLNLNPGTLLSAKTTISAIGQAVRGWTDRGGNLLSSSLISPSYREPPVTSRYLPILHQIKTRPGTAAETQYGQTAHASVEYSYGNELMGFAHRKLNEVKTGKLKYAFGEVRRPYEIFRDNWLQEINGEVDGTDTIKLTAYSEVIYPKEVYTYLSESRTRQSFRNSFWKDDLDVNMSTAGADVATVSTNSLLTYQALMEGSSRAWRRTGERVYTYGETNSSVTSQGYTITPSDIFPGLEGLPSTDPGIMSDWPLDSFLYADFKDQMMGVSTDSGTLYGAASLMPCGELMLPSYGASVSYPVNNAFDFSKQKLLRNDSVNAQYVYSSPTMFRQGPTYSGAPMEGAFTLETTTLSDYDPANGNAARAALHLQDGAGNAFTFYPIGNHTAAVTASADTLSPYVYYWGIYPDGQSTADLLGDLQAALELAIAGTGGVPMKFSIGASSSNGNRMNLTSSLPGVFSDLTASPQIAGANDLFNDAKGKLERQMYGGTSSITHHQYLHNAPGGPDSRPPWLAGRERKYVEGSRKGELAARQYPFYDTYEKYAADLRAAGKEYTILPEFRVSKHIGEYLGADDVFTYIAGTLSITGANNSNFDGTSPEFFERYAQTDYIEFLDPFMKPTSADLSFNKYPKHFEIKSDTMVKLLPYDGFYPVNRTLEIATLFSQSYSSTDADPYFTGASGSSGERFRTLLRPYFAPGIMYNSIKSGMAIDYPILRGNGKSAPINKHATIDRAPFPRPSNALMGIKSGSYTSVVGSACIPGNRRRAPAGGWNFQDALSGSDLATFWWSERLPFESILDPAPYLAGVKSSGQDPDGILLSDINEHMYSEITGSILGDPDDLLYKKAMSNFLANAPSFFLKKKTSNGGNAGHMTKFVANFGATTAGSAGTRKTVMVDPSTTYMMEIGLMKTSKFNLYSNPYAFGVPTATGSLASKDWENYTVAKEVPSGSAWPYHRGEFAPFTPPYYYGASIARITYMPPPNSDGRAYEVSLDEIMGDSAENTWVEFVNESGSYYDFDSGSFRSNENGSFTATTTTPPYKWNRAWQNRMDIDASIVIDNKFPADNGFMNPRDPNKWVIMPKWECPILDFPSGSNSATGRYSFSSSVVTRQFDSPTFGMWHQYGVEPSASQGVYLFLRNVNSEDSDLRLVGDPTHIDGDGSPDPLGKYELCSKIPRFVYESRGSSSPRISSLAQLVGFSPDEIIDQGWDPSKAKRLGELESSDGKNYKSISEAIVAMPYYTDNDGTPRTLNLKGGYSEIGPKVKEFRQVFTKYSMPPNLALRLLPFLPKDWPTIPSMVNPFGKDSLDQLLETDAVEYSVPIVYLMEHTVPLTKQDLADIWQGVMPEIGTTVQKSVTAIDHYMPGNSEGRETDTFPEILKLQEELGLELTGVPRIDLLDTSIGKDGFHPEIKWIVFKVKQRGVPSYTDLIRDEIDGYDSMSYLAQTRLTRDLDAEVINERGELILTDEEEERRTNHTKMAYLAFQSYRGGDGSSVTYNWPYDMCSLIETAKITTKVGFRPDLEKEIVEYNELRELQRNFGASSAGASLANNSNSADLRLQDNRSTSQPSLAEQQSPSITPSISPSAAQAVQSTLRLAQQSARAISGYARNTFRPR